MVLDTVALFTFALGGAALLASPGPAIAGLLAVSRQSSVAGGVRFYLGLQVGMALAAAVSAAGVVSLLARFPLIQTLMTLGGALYLLYLAYGLATRAIEANRDDPKLSSGLGLSGFFLGLTNPTVYLVFAALMSSAVLVLGNPVWDAVTKWAVLVGVMVVVGALWFGLGLWLNHAGLSLRLQRWVNRGLSGMMVLAVAGLVL